MLIYGEDGRAVELRGFDYNDEESLKRVVRQNPNLLLGETYALQKRPAYVLLAEELPLPNDSRHRRIDQLVIGPDAVLCTLEFKLIKDGRVCREVVGQGLEYYGLLLNASNAINEIRDSFEKSTQDPVHKIGSLFDKSFSSIDYEDFWELSQENLRMRRLRVIFVVDRVPPELAQSVQYLNGMETKSEFLAVEVRQLISDSGRAVYVSNVIGRQGMPRLLDHRPSPASLITFRLTSDTRWIADLLDSYVAPRNRSEFIRRCLVKGLQSIPEAKSLIQRLKEEQTKFPYLE